MSKDINITSRREFMAAGIGVAAMATTIGFNRVAQAQEAANPLTVIVSFKIKAGKAKKYGQQ